jgi:hypothetical protein
MPKKEKEKSLPSTFHPFPRPPEELQSKSGNAPLNSSE